MPVLEELSVDRAGNDAHDHDHSTLPKYLQIHETLVIVGGYIFTADA